MSRTRAIYSCPDHPYDHDRSCCPGRGIQTPIRGKGRKDLWAYTHSFHINDKVQIKSKGHFEAECRKRGLGYVVKDDLLVNGEAPPNPVKPISQELIAQAARTVVPKVCKAMASGELA